MKRTTIMADENLLERLRRIAHEEALSLAEVIRQGLELRARASVRQLTCIGAGASSDGQHDTAARSADMQFEPPSWR